MQKRTESEVVALQQIAKADSVLEPKLRREYNVFYTGDYMENDEGEIVIFEGSEVYSNWRDCRYYYKRLYAGRYQGDQVHIVWDDSETKGEVCCIDGGESSYWPIERVRGPIE